MDKKWEAYKRYDWAGDSDWQNYLSNLFPTPPSVKVEKFRRKWYKKNKDPDFDVDHDATNPKPENYKGAQQNRGMSDQDRFYQQYQQQYQRENPTGAYTAMNMGQEKIAALKYPNLGMWFMYIFLYPIGFYTNICCALAQIFGIARKAGVPKMNMEYVQSFVQLEEFSNLSYLLSITTSQGGFFVHAPLILSGILILCVEFKKLLDTNPSFPILSIASVKQNILKGATLEVQDQGRNFKGDLELYVGFYLVAMIFIGKSTIITIVFYWQMMRMRYMMNPHIQQAFQRLDLNIQIYLNHPYCPGVCRSAYTTVKGLLVGLVDVQGQQQRVQESGGGIMGAVKNSCNIF